MGVSSDFECRCCPLIVWWSIAVYLKYIRHCIFMIAIRIYIQFQVHRMLSLVKGHPFVRDRACGNWWKCRPSFEDANWRTGSQTPAMFPTQCFKHLQTTRCYWMEIHQREYRLMCASLGTQPYDLSHLSHTKYRYLSRSGTLDSYNLIRMASTKTFAQWDFRHAMSWTPKWCHTFGCKRSPPSQHVRHWMNHPTLHLIDVIYYYVCIFLWFKLQTNHRK